MHETRKLTRFLAKYRLFVILAPLMMIGEVAMDLMQPRLTQTIIDDGVAAGDLSKVLQTGAIMIGLAVIGCIFGVLCGVFAVRAGLGFAADLRSALFSKIQKLSFANLDKLETGSLITRLTNDVTQLSDAVQSLLRIMVRAPFMLVGAIFMATLTAPRLSLLFIVLIPFLILVVAMTMVRAFPRFMKVQAKLDHLNNVMQENLQGVRVVKAFARHQYEVDRFGKGNDDLRDTTLSAVYVIVMVAPLMMLTVNLGLVATLWFGGHQVNDGDIEVGALVAFINYLMQALFGLLMFSMTLMRFTRAEASAERVNEVLASEPAVVQSPAASVPATMPGKVEFQAVSFTYGDGEPVLQDVSFTVEPGTSLAILGPTGSGKSSIVSLIPRFYDVTSGRVLVDDMDVREWDEHRLRDHISIALQESVLFSGTVRENIRFGKPDATDAEVERAAQMAQAEEFINHLDDGYDSVIGQRGVNLSGGQRQRLAIARAIVRGAPILILDDSTSAVDVATERRIQEALASLHMTVILVAQRISAVVNATNIIVLENGRIVAQGNHEELIATSDVYQEIYRSQVESGVANGQ
ncbi:MAG: ABC transporter ATP-binding protein [Thermomicrobiales bacterium]|nr:ABC transporter ATP-binding protein [Thermomicrobiales bacterium]